MRTKISKMACWEDLLRMDMSFTDYQETNKELVFQVFN